MFSLCFLSFSLFLFYTLFSFLSFSHTILAEHTPLFLLTAVTLKCTAFNNQRKCVRVCGCVRARKCEGVRAWVREQVWGSERERCPIQSPIRVLLKRHSRGMFYVFVQHKRKKIQATKKVSKQKLKQKNWSRRKKRLPRKWQIFCQVLRFRVETGGRYYKPWTVVNY